MMYDKIPPNPNSPHQLTIYLSKRGESKLEAFHDRFAHFANCGMRTSLADNLNLLGTARYNLTIRHKRGFLSVRNKEQRRAIPVAWELVVPYWNHSELWYINNLAASVGIALPFSNAERLPKDNGERFFSEYITSVRPASQKYNNLDFCMCSFCTIPNWPNPQLLDSPGHSPVASTPPPQNEQEYNTISQHS
jgi:hypothetical protein